LREQVALAHERAAREQAEQTVRFSEMFAGMLGHDLRNPLSAIITGAHVVLAQPTHDRQRDAARRIASSGERMARMIDQLLDFTRLRLGGGLVIEPVSTDLGELTRQIIDEIEAAHACSIELERQGDISGVWDRDRLGQVLSNLLGNAAHHGRRDCPIAVHIDGRKPREVRLEVRNQGGIPEPILPLLFEPFRGSKTPRGSSRGLGLGLYITREIVRAHGGDIDVSSSEQAGTCIWVRLPRRALDSPRQRNS
jgi:signal transduction histidine kinase